MSYYLIFFSNLSTFAWVLGISPLQWVLILSKTDWQAGHPTKHLPISFKVKIQMIYKGLHIHLDVPTLYLSKHVPLGLPYVSFLFPEHLCSIPRRGHPRRIQSHLTVDHHALGWTISLSQLNLWLLDRFCNFPFSSNWVGLESPTELQAFLSHGQHRLVT